MNNLPAGLIAGSAVQSAHVPDQITRAVLIGVDLGPEPVGHRLARHDPVAHRAAARRPDRQRRRFPQARHRGDAAGAAARDRRRITVQVIMRVTGTRRN